MGDADDLTLVGRLAGGASDPTRIALYNLGLARGQLRALYHERVDLRKQYEEAGEPMPWFVREMVNGHIGYWRNVRRNCNRELMVKSEFFPDATPLTTWHR